MLKIEGFTVWARYAKRWLQAHYNSGLDWSARLEAPEGKEMEPKNKRVLIATSVAGHLTALNVEAVVAKSLQVRGYKVDALLCDSVLPACMDCQYSYFPTTSTRKRLLADGPKALCVSCTTAGVKVYENLGISVQFYSQYLHKDDLGTIEKLMSETAFGEIRQFQLDSISIGEHAYAGALRFFARGEVSKEPMSEEIIKRYFRAALLAVFMTRNLLKNNAYDVCVLNHGIYVPQGLISEVCRASGVRVVTWNPAYRRGCFIFSHETTYHHTLMSEPTTVWENMDWNDDIESDLMQYLHSRMEGTRDWISFQGKPEFDVGLIEQSLNIDFSKPTIGLLTNVVWDAQLHYPANSFRHMVEWILETISWFANHAELQLVIRVHPAEIRGSVPSRQKVVDEIQQAFSQLPSNVFVIGPESQYSTYAVMNQCDAVLIYGTKTGVELTSIGVPVIVAGEAWIRDKGITEDSSSKEDYFSILERLPYRARLQDDRIRRARMYAYHFFFRRMVPVSFMAERKGWPSIEPILNSVNELEAGMDLGLDIICDGIGTGSPFVYPAEKLMTARRAV
jgi:hypothetical protein